MARAADARQTPAVRIAKPLLLVTTPLGLAIGFREAYRLTGGLVALMIAMVGLLAVAAAGVIATIRREQSADEARRRAAAPDEREPTGP